MKSVAVLLLAVVAYVVAAPQYTEEYFQVHQECQADDVYRIVDMSVFSQLEFEKIPAKDVQFPSNFNDHMSCMYSKLGLFDDNGDIIVDLAAEKLKTFFSNQNLAPQIVTACGGIANASDDLAETSGLFYLCILDYFA
ncbi:uncharacterized protein LOC132708042 [Cylas formicarius]|uniref:uncharacterized protein LOC132708042 n=1 Tax=Cylas formicarius TaxID=197179 RepID=UPI002958D1B0|nr:uncharacterized protein LOC132708042 [Cylas formicarius]